MGINNLLPFVKKACRKGNISEFAGCSVAVDVSCLLHRGLFGCVESVAQGKKTNFYIFYVDKYVKALRNLGCHVILVFDGRPLPAKKNTNDERRLRRADNVRAGELLLSEGRVSEAVDKFKRATSITAEIVGNTIQHFRNSENVDVIVSPYESDAQLAFLVNDGLADVVVTEDSDLIAFGCEKIIFKWNCGNGECTIYEKNQLYKCFTGIMNSHFDFTKFRRICILSGCDYLQAGLPGIGLNKALSFFSKTSRTDPRKLLPLIPIYLNMPKLSVSKEFIDEFIRAENTFLYQVVFDPRRRCQRPLTPYPFPLQAGQVDENNEDFSKPIDYPAKIDFWYAGEVLPSSLAVRLALGNKIDHSVTSDMFYLPAAVPEWSVWCGSYETQGKRKRRLGKEKREEERKCGDVFKFDSPTRKRPKVGTSAAECLIVLDGEPHSRGQKLPSSLPSPPCSQQSSSSWQLSCEQQKREQLEEERTKLTPLQIPREKSVKNEAMGNWTVEEVMQAHSPQNKREAGCCTTTQFISLGRSAYFVRRSASCANPFRRPEVTSAQSNASVRVPLTEPSPLLGNRQEEEEGTSAKTAALINAVGCRPSGLRASLRS